ncbi:hypothetical protein BD626DRAFT_514177 [Schizophyllum amplum]|uniref:Uncharacterized protein n=1 Tax=Schizophyllum amplum TaxID=97359 RepID=A0A550BYY2_9AGAR|nr:hypothetical protein BD626DRAFT_514177 [Auriculariopsis ampla]
MHSKPCVRPFQSTRMHLLIPMSLFIDLGRCEEFNRDDACDISRSPASLLAAHASSVEDLTDSALALCQKSGARV